MDERARIERMARVFAGASPGVIVGIGDDAAVLDPAAGRGLLVWTVDEQVEGVHFRRDLASWRDVGWRSFMAAASDVAAMGAAPWCALSALVLPADLADADLEALSLGQRDAARRCCAPVVGGNLSKGPVVSVTTTLLGRAERPVPRGGARPGDGLWLAGKVGLAAAGLRALLAGKTEHLGPAIDAWREPRALVDEGLALAGVAHAAVDVSDGLARDAGHMAEASGVGLVLDGDALLADGDLVAAARALGVDPLELALHGGEDYALVAASPAPLPGYRRVGEVRGGAGLALRRGPLESPLEARGFDHFTSRSRPPGASRP